MKIYFTNGSLKGKDFELIEDEINIGREVDNDIILETDGVSRYHAKLFRQIDGGWLLEDMDSMNGSKVNGKIIDDEKLLNEGDLIGVGDQEMRLGEDKTKPKPKTKTKAKPDDIPIIQTIEEPVKEKDEEAVIEKAVDNKNIVQTVKKIVFEPMPKKAGKKAKAAEKSSGPKSILETVKLKTTDNKTQAKPEKKPQITAEALSENETNIFGEQKEKSSSVKKKSAQGAAKKHILNFMFYVFLLMAVVVFVFIFLDSNKETKKNKHCPHKYKCENTPDLILCQK